MVSVTSTPDDPFLPLIELDLTASYDALGRRITQDESGATTDLYYSDRGQVIEEQQADPTTGQSQTTTQYVWSPFYVNQLVERDDQPDGSGSLTRRLYVEQDANYNVTSLTDASGNVVERYLYDPYGSMTVEAPNGDVRGDGRITSSAFGMQYLFQGGRIDPGTGAYHFGAADYDPSTGRWEQQDPAGYINGANQYQLELSDPNSSLGPSGLNDENDEDQLFGAHGDGEGSAGYQFDPINQGVIAGDVARAEQAMQEKFAQEQAYAAEKAVQSKADQNQTGGAGGQLMSPPLRDPAAPEPESPAADPANANDGDSNNEDSSEKDDENGDPSGEKQAPTTEAGDDGSGRNWQPQQQQQQQGKGSYTNWHQSGKSYDGKGGKDRMADSANRIANANDDPVVSQTHTTAPDDKQSFIDEQNNIEAHGGPGGNTYNKINSPGKKLRDGE